jgi:hypothetical protein
MTEFWGFPGADKAAIVLIISLCALCLYQARNWVKKL